MSDITEEIKWQYEINSFIQNNLDYVYNKEIEYFEIEDFLKDFNYKKFWDFVYNKTIEKPFLSEDFIQKNIKNKKEKAPYVKINQLLAQNLDFIKELNNKIIRSFIDLQEVFIWKYKIKNHLDIQLINIVNNDYIWEINLLISDFYKNIEDLVDDSGIIVDYTKDRIYSKIQEVFKRFEKRIEDNKIDIDFDLDRFENLMIKKDNYWSMVYFEMFAYLNTDLFQIKMTYITYYVSQLKRKGSLDAFLELLNINEILSKKFLNKLNTEAKILEYFFYSSSRLLVRFFYIFWNHQSYFRILTSKFYTNIDLLSNFFVFISYYFLRIIKYNTIDLYYSFLKEEFKERGKEVKNVVNLIYNIGNHTNTLRFAKKNPKPIKEISEEKGNNTLDNFLEYILGAKITSVYGNYYFNYRRIYYNKQYEKRGEEMQNEINWSDLVWETEAEDRNVEVVVEAIHNSQEGELINQGFSILEAQVWDKDEVMLFFLELLKKEAINKDFTSFSRVVNLYMKYKEYLIEILILLSKEIYLYKKLTKLNREPFRIWKAIEKIIKIDNIQKSDYREKSERYKKEIGLVPYKEYMKNREGCNKKELLEILLFSLLDIAKEIKENHKQGKYLIAIEDIFYEEDIKKIDTSLLLDTLMFDFLELTSFMEDYIRKKVSKKIWKTIYKELSKQENQFLKEVAEDLDIYFRLEEFFSTILYKIIT